MTRRELISAVARVGGIGLATSFIENIGLAAEPVRTDLDSLDPAGSNPPEVLILGAGIAGMCAAHELESLGYRCRILEARHRSGGRCVTIRGGDHIEEPGEVQICRYDKGNYFNPGPTRIPHWHSTIDYCRKFGVALAPFVNVNEAAFIYQTRGKLKDRRLPIRDVIADTEGHMAALLSAAIRSGNCGADWSPSDKSAILQYLALYGFLDRNGTYRGVDRRSMRDFDPVGRDRPKFADPIDVVELFAGGVGTYFEFINAIDQQSTMLEVVGGVDRLAKAFESNLRARIEFGCEVTEIRVAPSETTVTFKNASGRTQVGRAPYCICTIPLTVLRKIPANFSADAATAIQKAFYPHITKVGSEFGSRFWETEDRIYGGISWTDQTIRQIMYPSYGFHSGSGVLVNYSNGFDSAVLGIGSVWIRALLALALAVGFVNEAIARSCSEFELWKRHVLAADQKAAVVGYAEQVHIINAPKNPTAIKVGVTWHDPSSSSAGRDCLESQSVRVIGRGSEIFLFCPPHLDLHIFCAGSSRVREIDNSPCAQGIQFRELLPFRVRDIQIGSLGAKHRRTRGVGLLLRCKRPEFGGFGSKNSRVQATARDISRFLCGCLSVRPSVLSFGDLRLHLFPLLAQNSHLNTREDGDENSCESNNKIANRYLPKAVLWVVLRRFCVWVSAMIAGYYLYGRSRVRRRLANVAWGIGLIYGCLLPFTPLTWGWPL